MIRFFRKIFYLGLNVTFITKPYSNQVKLTNGSGPCHVNLDEENGILHVANYNGGSYAAFSINKSNGAIQERIFFESFGKGSNVVPDRQAEAHAHMVFFINDFIFVVDLGSDKIHHYKVNLSMNFGNQIFTKHTFLFT